MYTQASRIAKKKLHCCLPLFIVLFRRERSATNFALRKHTAE